MEEGGRPVLAFVPGCVRDGWVWSVAHLVRVFGRVRGSDRG